MKILSKMKDVIGITDLEEDEMYEEDEAYHQNDHDYEAKEKSNSYRKKNNIINVHSNVDMKLYICEPKKYEDCTKTVDELKKRKPVVLNLENLDMEIKKQIFEFIKGSVYALEASIQKISKEIFIIAPSNVQIDGQLKDRLEKNYFPWK